jgi:hypothetical protein
MILSTLFRSAGFLSVWLVSAPIAEAACAAADLVGKWQMTGVFIDKSFRSGQPPILDDVSTMLCTVTIAQTGSATGSCFIDRKTGTPAPLPASFRFATTSKCRVTYSYVDEDSGSRVTPFSGYLNSGKDVIIGTMILPDDKSIRPLQLIRIP